jgi:methionyl-tRNA synthetase
MRVTTCLLRTRFSHFVTTPIYYVNAPPHIGHVYTSVIADAEKRFRKLTLAKDERVFLSTGTDEHGIKIQRAAQEQRVGTKTFCNQVKQIDEGLRILKLYSKLTMQVSARYRSIFSLYGIDHDDYVRTSDARHVDTVKILWNTISDKGHLEKATYAGWYSVQDETFVKESQIDEKRDDNGKVVKVSTESGHVLEWTEEENYVFKLSRFRQRLKDWLDGGVIRPTHFRSVWNVSYKKYVLWDSVLSFRNHLNNLFSSDEMGDLSVSRPIARQQWGIPVPGDPGQVVYVWLDALANYLTVAGWDGSDVAFWPPDVHVIGKDILTFHAVYWPAFLMAAEIDPLPRRIQCHSHWMVGDKKMSKSKGNVVCPVAMADRYTAEGVRYFLLREGVPQHDGNFNESTLVKVLNNELANTLGNLLNRCTSKSVNALQTNPGRPLPQDFDPHCSTQGANLLSTLESLGDRVGEEFENFKHAHGVDHVMEVLRRTNEYVQEEKPWELKKSSPERLKVVLHLAMDSLRVCGILLQPIVPNLCTQMLDKLNVKDRQWKDAKPIKSLSDDVALSNESVVLFRKIKP